MIYNIQIAIIDDHHIFMEGLKMLLQQEKEFEVIYTCDNHIDLLKKMADQQPDILITDISMPGMNGVELSKMIKNNYPKVKIMVMSSYSNVLSDKEIDAYLLKDTDSDILIESIKKVVLENKKVFYQDFKPSEILEFNKNIVSKREKEIINLISNGYTSDDISLKLHISKHTIETHRKNIFMKLQVNNIAALVKKAIALGLIEY